MTLEPDPNDPLASPHEADFAGGPIDPSMAVPGLAPMTPQGPGVDSSPWEGGVDAGASGWADAGGVGAADFAPLTLESFDWSFWMLFRRTVHPHIDPDPIAHHRDFTKWDSSLGHPPWSRVHA